VSLSCHRSVTMSSLKSYAGSSTYRDMLNVYDHILDPNERRRLLLSEIDKSPFGWYHVRAVVVAGAGFFTDAYDVCGRVSVFLAGLHH
jgi:hypothetical protein